MSCRQWHQHTHFLSRSHFHETKCAVNKIFDWIKMRHSNKMCCRSDFFGWFLMGYSSCWCSNLFLTVHDSKSYLFKSSTFGWPIVMSSSHYSMAVGLCLAQMHLWPSAASTQSLRAPQVAHLPPSLSSTPSHPSLALFFSLFPLSHALSLAVSRCLSLAVCRAYSLSLSLFFFRSLVQLVGTQKYANVGSQTNLYSFVNRTRNSRNLQIWKSMQLWDHTQKFVNKTQFATDCHDRTARTLWDKNANLGNVPNHHIRPIESAPDWEYFLITLPYILHSPHDTPLVTLLSLH